jgi:hypothetical protein
VISIGSQSANQELDLTAQRFGGKPSTYYNSNCTNQKSTGNIKIRNQYKHGYSPESMVVMFKIILGNHSSSMVSKKSKLGFLDQIILIQRSVRQFLYRINGSVEFKS